MLRDIRVMPHHRGKRSGTDTGNRRFDRIHAQSVCSNRPYPTSLSVFIGAARDADILTSEGKTMNGSAQSGNRPSSCMGWACRRERQRAGAERVEGVAARRLWPHSGEWDPRQEEPRIVSLRVARTGSIRVPQLETATRAAMFRHAHDDRGCGRDSLEASRRHRRRAPACMRYPAPRAPPY